MCELDAKISGVDHAVHLLCLTVGIPSYGKFAAGRARTIETGRRH